MRQKFRGAANLRSTPGGRQASYATALPSLSADHGIGGLLCHCLVAWSPWFIFLLYTYDYLYFILFSFQIVSSFVRDSSYHDMYYKGCGLLCAHKKSFNTAIPVRSLGPYMCVHYCTYIVHILV